MGKNKIRVFLQILSNGKYGGAEKSVQWFAELANRDIFDYYFLFLFDGGPIQRSIVDLGYPTEVMKWRNGYSILGRFRLLKYLWSLKPDLIHDHGETPSVRVLIKLIYAAPIISTQHRSIQKSNNIIKNILLFFDDKATSLVIANSNYTANNYEAFHKKSKNKIRTIFLGINPDHYVHTSDKYIVKSNDTEKVRIIFIGRLEEDKGALHLPFLLDH